MAAIKIQLERVSLCPVCKADMNLHNRKFVCSVAELPQISYYKCKSCGTIFQDPTIQDTENFYKEHYRKLLFPDSPQNISEGEKENEDRRAKTQCEFVHLLLMRLDMPSFFDHLDIGCGLGYLGWHLRRLGMVTNTYGTELNADYLQYAQETHSISAHQEGTCYDFITLSHVLEHTIDPRSMISMVLTHLKPGGVLMIDVPNGRVNRFAYRVYHPVVYDEQTLRYFMSRYNDTLSNFTTEFYHDSWQPVDENLLTFWTRIA